MKKIVLSSVFCLLFVSSFSQSKQLKLGNSLPKTDKLLCASSEKEYSLEDLSQKKGLLVIFTCNTCPFVIEWETTYSSLYDLSSKNEIGMVLINSNEDKRKGDDSKEAMKKHSAEKGYSNIPYLVDTDNKVADLFGASTTPHVYLFDKNNKLVFIGAIDDRYENKERKVNSPFLNNAIEELCNNKPISNPSTKNKGCSIKRK